jgi:hypothetical protein
VTKVVDARSIAARIPTATGTGTKAGIATQSRAATDTAAQTATRAATGTAQANATVAAAAAPLAPAPAVSPDLSRAVLAEVRTALRGRTAAELAETLEAPAVAVDGAVRALAAAGVVVARGARFYVA